MTLTFEALESHKKKINYTKFLPDTFFTVVSRSAPIQFPDEMNEPDSLENDVEIVNDQEDAEVEVSIPRDTKISERVIESVITINISPQSRLMASPGTTAMVGWINGRDLGGLRERK